MSNLCKTRLCGTVVDRVCDSAKAECTVTDTLFSTISLDNVETTNRISKANFGELPDASTLPNGHVAFLDDATVPVIASNGTWIGLDGRVVGSVIERNLWAWGSNSSGQLGDATVIDRCSAVREVCLSTDWCQVTAGSGFSSAIKTSGELWSWGYNVCGQLGDGTAGTGLCRISPVREACSATNWCLVSSGQFGSHAIKTDGSLWSWGRNNCGVLGIGSTINRVAPAREFCSATDWCSISGKPSFQVAAVKTSGQLWAWGLNNVGQLGDGTTTQVCSPVREFCSATDWCQVSTGNGITTALKTSGQIWTWGSGTNGMLGDGTTVSKCSPVREFCSATDWCQVRDGGGMAALKTSGQIWSWGCGTCGALGDGTAASKCSPVREICSSTDWCQLSRNVSGTNAIKTNGQLWSWGSGQCGRIGDGVVVDRCSPVREFYSATDWCQVSSGGQTLAIRLTTRVIR